MYDLNIKLVKNLPITVPSAIVARDWKVATIAEGSGLVT